MSIVNLTIDGIAVNIEAEATILDAAKSIGIKIPTLCHHPDQSVKANCRVCLVDINGRLFPSCATRVSEGMSVQTRSEAAISARKTSLELILSHHSMDCQHCARNGVCEVVDLSDEMCSYCYFCDCVQDGNCELQELARELNVTFGDFPWTGGTEEKMDQSTASIVKDYNKCILCRRCIGSCSETQGIHAWSITGRGEHSKIVPALDVPLDESPCVKCGLCIKECPTGALSAKSQFMDIYEPVDDNTVTVVACIDNNFLDEFASLGGYSQLSLTEKNLVAGLHRVGVDVVLSGEDVARTAMSQLETELANRLTDSSQRKPLIAFSSFDARNYAERNYAELASGFSAADSPQQLFDKYFKSEWADRHSLKPEDIYTVYLTSSISEKEEAAGDSTAGAVDLVLTPLEVRRLFLRRGADLALLKPEEYDLPAEYSEVRKKFSDDRNIAIWKINGKQFQFRAAEAKNLRQAGQLLEEAKSGKSPFALIYISSCKSEKADLDGLLSSFGSVSIEV